MSREGQNIVFVRVLTAFALLIPVLFLLYWRGLPFLILLFVCNVIVIWEYVSIAVAKEFKEKLLFSSVLSVPAFWAALNGGVSVAPFSLLLSTWTIWLVLIIDVALHDISKRSFNKLFAALMGLCYPVLFGVFLLVAAVRSSNQEIVWLLSVVILNDTCAFFGGRSIGGLKLVPSISPNKTVSCFICGLLGGAAASLIVISLFSIEVSVLWGAVLGLLCALLASIGDLAESLLKRFCGVKDSGSLLPGHGGLLDRLDALLFAAPLLYILSL